MQCLAFVAGAALVLGACGGSADSAAPNSTSTTTGGTSAGGARGAQNAAFTTCLKEHGVTLPAGGPGVPGGNAGTPPSFPEGGPPEGGLPTGATPGSFPGLSEKQQAAFDECRSKLPEGGNFNGRGGGNPQALQAYLSCLADHGVTVPTTSSGSTAGAPGGGLAGARNDPDFATANQTCAPLLPSAGSTTTTSPN